MKTTVALDVDELAEFKRKNIQLLAMNSKNIILSDALAVMLDIKYAAATLYYANNTNSITMTIRDFIVDFAKLRCAQYLSDPDNLINRLEIKLSNRASYIVDFDELVRHDVALERMLPYAPLELSSYHSLNLYRRRQQLYNCGRIIARAMVCISMLCWLLFLIFLFQDAKVAGINLYAIFGFASVASCMCATMPICCDELIAVICKKCYSIKPLQRKCIADIGKISEMVLDIAASRMLIKEFERSIVISNSLQYCPDVIVDEILSYSINMGIVKDAMGDLFDERQYNKLFNYFNDKKYVITLDMGDDHVHYGDNYDGDNISSALLSLRPNLRP